MTGFYFLYGRGIGTDTEVINPKRMDKVRSCSDREGGLGHARVSRKHMDVRSDLSPRPIFFSGHSVAEYILHALCPVKNELKTCQKLFGEIANYHEAPHVMLHIDGTIVNGISMNGPWFKF